MDQCHRVDPVLAVAKQLLDRRVALVVGADGIHSHVRRLVFGDERQFAVYLGYYFATFPLPNLDHFEEGAIISMESNRQATVYPDHRGGFTALLAYRAQNAGSIAAGQRKAMLETHYQGAGWVIPQIAVPLVALHRRG